MQPESDRVDRTPGPVKLAAYGLDPATTTALRAWALQWDDDLAARLLAEIDIPDID